MKAYEEAPPNTTAQIITHEKRVAKSVGLDDRIDFLAMKDSFNTLFNTQRINATVLEHINVN